MMDNLCRKLGKCISYVQSKKYISYILIKKPVEILFTGVPSEIISLKFPDLSIKAWIELDKKMVDIIDLNIQLTVKGKKLT